jgi:predicted phosphodiesterase
MDLPSTGVLASFEAFERLPGIGLLRTEEGSGNVYLQSHIHKKSYHTSDYIILFNPGNLRGKGEKNVPYAYIRYFQSNLRVKGASGIVIKLLSEEFWL